MPDWSYHVIFQPILTKLSPSTSREFIHRGMNTIASLPLGPHIINFLGREESSPYLKRSLNGIELKNPVGLSGKIDPLQSGTKAFSNLGFGFLEIGPLTIAPTKTEKQPIVDRKKQQIIFPDSSPSIGLLATIEKLKKLRKKQPLLLRLSGRPSEINEMILQLEPYADGYIIESFETNFISSPTKPLFIGISLDHLAKTDFELLNSCAGIVINSGAGTFQDLLKNVENWRKRGFQQSIITSGGIVEPENALQLLNAGVDAVMLSDGYVFSGPGLTKRVNEALVSSVLVESSPQKGWFSYWIFGLFIFLGGLLALLFSLTSIILPYDEAFLNMKKEVIWQFNDRIMLFMAHDRMTLAGTMISGGIVYMTLAYYGIRQKLRWAKQATDVAAIIGFLGIFSFIGFGYFDWLHLLFWLILLPFFLYGFFQTRGICGTPSSSNRKNDSSWYRSLFGQFLLVLLGFSFVVGGVVISTFGVTSVFVPTDLLYICMTPEQLQQFNQDLIPVMAHDRAGFGSALLSVGLLVLMLALWGFQQGNKWVWWTFFVGGLPAFISGIYIHYAIGYTSFVHLLPAYFAIGLYVGGLLLSFSFFHKLR
ncbi:dihydroorotate dehydrogenase [Bacillus sp. 2205SS5-2]|uniref:dihydroorotate dehydrogenase n=1 Tax=Bacillus sp. 2205SS5-2 TaxID=3109031 RepID=UPI0030043F9C